MARHIEHDHQKLLITWSQYTWLPCKKKHVYDLLVHIPNGGSRASAREGANLKAQGVRSGFPDLFLFYPVDNYHGLGLELKRPIVQGQRKPQVTQQQKAWLAALHGQGYATAIAYGFNDAVDIIEKYLHI